MEAAASPELQKTNSQLGLERRDGYSLRLKIPSKPILYVRTRPILRKIKCFKRSVRLPPYTKEKNRFDDTANGSSTRARITCTGGGYFRDGACPKGPPALTLQPTQAHRHDLSETHNKTISAHSLGTGFRPPHDFRRPGGRGARERLSRRAQRGAAGNAHCGRQGGAVRTWVAE